MPARSIVANWLNPRLVLNSREQDGEKKQVRVTVSALGDPCMHTFMRVYIPWIHIWILLVLAGVFSSANSGIMRALAWAGVIATINLGPGRWCDAWWYLSARNVHTAGWRIASQKGVANGVRNYFQNLRVKEQALLVHQKKKMPEFLIIILN